jgi:hypothetical protein
MKYIVITTALFVLPFTLLALELRVMEKTSEITDASQEATIMPQPALRLSFRSRIFPRSGTMMRTMTIK